MDDQVGHVPDQIRGQPEVEQHVEDVEDHLPRVHRVEIAIAHGGEGGDRPVHRCHIADPQTGLLKVLDCNSDPCLAGVVVPGSYKIVEASGTVDGKQGHLCCRPKLTQNGS